MAREKEYGVTPKLTCDYCGQVIGVYEPMVVIAAGHARETSRAAEQVAAAAPRPHYHRDCYAERLRSSGPTAPLRQAL